MNDNFQLKVPHVGEGVHYVTLLRLLKQEGEWVEEDDEIIEIETDKATMGLPSPKSGFVSKIQFKEGDTVNVGEVLLEIAHSGNPQEDEPVYSFKQKRKKEVLKEKENIDDQKKQTINLPAVQVEFIKHLKNSQSIVAQTNIEKPIDWEKISAIRQGLRTHGDSGAVPSSLEIITWATSQAMLKNDKFRSRLFPDLELQVSSASLIGIAVAMPDDTLAMPVISVNVGDTFEKTRNDIKKAVTESKRNHTHKSAYHSLSISDMSALGITRAQPIVVYPVVATLFIGVPYYTFIKDHGVSRFSNFVLAFDHRLINGAYAARFLKDIEHSIGELYKKILSAGIGLP